MQSKPSDLASWSIRFNQQQSDLLKAEQAANAAVELEIAEARKVREARRSSRTRFPSTSSSSWYSSVNGTPAPVSKTTLPSDPSRQHGPLASYSPAVPSFLSSEMPNPSQSATRPSALSREPSSPTKRSRFDSEDRAQEQRDTQEREHVKGFSFASTDSSGSAKKPTWMTRHQTTDGSSNRSTLPSATSAVTSASSSSSLLSRHRSTHSTSILASPLSTAAPDAARPAWMKRKSTVEVPTSTSTFPTLTPSPAMNHLSSTSILSRSTSRHRSNVSTSAIPPPSPQQQNLSSSNSLLRPHPPPASPTQVPILPATTASNAFLSSTSLQNRGATPSLTRLKGRGIVGEQLRKNELREEVDEMGVTKETGSVGSMEGRKSDSWKKEDSRMRTQTMEPPKPKWQSPPHKQPVSSHTFVKPSLHSTTSSSASKTAFPPSPPRPVKVKTSDKLFPLRSATPTNAAATRAPQSSTPISTTTPFLFASPRINVKSFVQSVDSTRAIASPKLSQPSPRLGLGISTPSISASAAAPSPIGLGKRKPPPSSPSNTNGNHDHPFAPPTKSPKSSLRGLAHSSLRKKDVPAVPKLQDAFCRPALTSRKTAEEREMRKVQASLGRKAGKSAVISSTPSAAVGEGSKMTSPWSAFLSDKGSVMDEEGAFNRREDGMPASSSTTSPFKGADPRQITSGLPSPTKTSFPPSFLPASISSQQAEPRPILRPIPSSNPVSVVDSPKPQLAVAKTQTKPASPIKINTSFPNNAFAQPPLSALAIESPYTAAKPIVSPSHASLKSANVAPVKVKSRPTSMVSPSLPETAKEEKSPGVVREKYELRDDGSPPVRKYELKDEGWVDPHPPVAGLVHPTRDRVKKPRKSATLAPLKTIVSAAVPSEPKATLSPAVIPTSATSGAFKPLSERLSVWNNQAPITIAPSPSSSAPASSVPSPTQASPLAASPRTESNEPPVVVAPPRKKGMVGAFALPGLAAPQATSPSASSKPTSPVSPNPPNSSTARPLPSAAPSVFTPPPADGPSMSTLIGSEHDVGGTIEPSKRALDSSGKRKTVMSFAGDQGGRENEKMTGVVEGKEKGKERPKKKKEVEMFRRKIDLTPLPRISVARLLSHPLPPTVLLQSLLASTSISTETLSINSVTGTTTLIQQPSSASTSPLFPHIFYDSETLAVIHRSKSPPSAGGLVNTHLWIWVGANAPSGEEKGKVGQKMEELEGRYKTTARIVFQGQEPEELGWVLGGRLVVRQGTREHFDGDNTALYSVRHLTGSTYVDQIDLAPSSLTSRHPLVLSVLSQTFLYIARGSLPSELTSAREYASTLSESTGSDVIVIEENAAGKSMREEEELFWMCFGEEDEDVGERGSRAEHWRWRGELEGKGGDELRVWRVDHEEDYPLVEIDPTFAPHVWSRPATVMLTPFELYVVVHDDARYQQTNIRLALKVAEDMSTHLNRSRPFKPPVHVLILPSRVPVDLAVYFRFLNVDLVVNGCLPHDHLNVLPLVNAKAQLAEEAFPKALLTDHNFLPLGLHWSDLSK